MLDGGMSIFAAFSLGLLGSGHCMVMCGGISCALGMSVERPRRYGAVHRWACLAGYQIGRVASYSLAGALVGGAALVVTAPLPGPGARLALRLLQALLLLLLGLYLTGLWRTPLAALERLGLGLWNRLAPLRRRVLPVRHPAQAVAFGLLWGGLPCALVYSALGLSLSAGSAQAGALAMFAFGLGTVPAMFAGSLFGRQLAVLSTDSWPRRAFGALMLLAGTGIGALGVAHALG